MFQIANKSTPNFALSFINHPIAEQASSYQKDGGTKIELRDFDYFALKEHCAWLDTMPFLSIFGTLLLTLYNFKVLLTDDYLRFFYSFFE